MVRVLCRFLSVSLAIFVTFSSMSQAETPKPSYAVVASKATHADAEWRKVIDALVERHGAEILLYDKTPAESLEPLQKLFPRHVCFVATPAEASREFVATVHQFTRKLDDDPYTDVLWGILTGFDAAGALRIAQCAEPLSIERVAAGAELQPVITDNFLLIPNPRTCDPERVYRVVFRAKPIGG